jgi:hypothetical protein
VYYRAFVAAVLMLCSQLLQAQPENFSPYLERRGMEQVFFGDTHLHTAYSSDAGLIGTTLTPADAYRFAQGQQVTSSRGVSARIGRPLDFLVISDHAESIGLPIAVREANPVLLTNPWGRKLFDLYQQGKGFQGFMMWAMDGMLPGIDPLREPSINADIWGRQARTADQFNQPGYFTALIGFEWTTTNNSKNLHRVVILRDDAERAMQVIPFSSWQSPDPERLWDWMDAYEEKTGGDILAIPHNGNLSNGLMFGPKRGDGSEFDTAYAARRVQKEPVVEVTQIKGDGEAHPWLSPDDEFADFGSWDWADIGARDPKTNDMLEYEYARSTLKNGLSYAAELGANPFQFGMIGSSDSHTALSTVREENYFSKFSQTEPHKGRAQNYVVQNRTGDDSLSWRVSDEVASGLAAVWARENTREALFDAIRSREVYATTGTRIRMRMFAGWDFDQSDLNSPDMASRGYQRGVPMGGELGFSSDGRAPTIMLFASKDPDGANLDRIQIIKGWLDEAGQQQERVVDIAWSGARETHASGKLAAVGTTVDLSKPSYSNSIGAAELKTVWRDPDFDPSQRSFYYARVLEIPTPAWQAYDAVRFGDEFPAKTQMAIQDRAYSSPIWYSPK